MAKYDVTKSSFSQKFLVFSEIFVEDVKLMLGKVLKVLRRYLLPYLSYRENPVGGGGYQPPPSGARVDDQSRDLAERNSLVLVAKRYDAWFGINLAWDSSPPRPIGGRFMPCSMYSGPARIM